MLSTLFSVLLRCEIIVYSSSGEGSWRTTAVHEYELHTKEVCDILYRYDA